jgi:GTPase SAR1 family protein
MANLNIKTREMECKIVFYGPGRGGKTTNLEYILKTYRKQITGKMIAINTKGDRTLFSNSPGPSIQQKGSRKRGNPPVVG